MPRELPHPTDPLPTVVNFLIDVDLVSFPGNFPAAIGSSIYYNAGPVMNNEGGGQSLNIDEIDLSPGSKKRLKEKASENSMISRASFR